MRTSSRIARPSRERGAVFVEALIVISVFILFLLGIIYFRELYVGQMRLQRLARAAAVAHSMGACDSDVRSTLKYDLGKDQTVRASASKDPPRPTDPEPPPPDTPTSKVNNVFGGVADKRGGTVLNEVDSVELRGNVKTTTKSGYFGKETGFRAAVGSGSYVSCGDELTSKQYEGLAESIPSLLGY